jgi:molybdopterin-guanine dinucleotide biosynthesis protein A
MTSIILAGGKSSRFGWSKVFETIGGKSLIQWAIDRLAKISTEIIIVTARGDCFASPSLCSGLRLTAMTFPPSTKIKIIADTYPGKGPLGGIYTGLAALTSSHAVVVGCDMPFINTVLLDYMTQFSSSFDVVVPRTGKGIEPLCAVYSKNCLAPIHSLLEHNELRVSELFNIVKMKYVEEGEINKFDPEHLSFFNINTQTDLAKARRSAMQKDDSLV